ncbi:MAG: GmrSD restriction endonuclease domain-containing protein, partial [Verrucomicrobiota bacterium]
MENVWKIGSKYGSHGDITRVFWQYQVVFAGNNTQRIRREVKKGDLVAVASGFTVIAIAKVLEDAEAVEKLGLKDEHASKFKGAFGARVRLLSLSKDDRLVYKERRSFVAANQIASKVRILYDKYLNAFEIRSNVFCLHAEDGSNGSILSLLGRNTVKYIIPIYQRPYSWGEKQLRRFVRDIGDGFVEGTPVFAGPIQLSFPVPVDHEKGTYLQEVIDGQQRLTTLRLLLKILEELADGPVLSPAVQDFWLETLVNQGEQQRALKAALEATLSELEEHPDRETNIYIKNIVILQGLVNEILDDEDVQVKGEQLIRYLCSQIRLVAVETYAGLSKTLKVF